ncbi:MAG: tetratricopeptide repeat protein [bacterium]|nr:tetratricopeptide repeat protein [bacterium]
MSSPGGRFFPFQLRAAKSDVLHRIGRWNELIAMLEQDLVRARELETPVYQGRCLLKLGIIEAQRGKFAEAEAKTAMALGIYQTAGDGPGIYQCRSTLLKIASNLKEYEKAENMALELMSEARLKQDRSSESEMLNNLGLVCLKMGRDKEALEYLNRKLELSKELGDEGGRASALGNIGGVYFARGQYDKAAACDRESIEISRRTGDVYAEYFALYNLAKACEQMGKMDEAMTYYRSDLEMARQLGDKPGEQDILEDIKRLTTAEVVEKTVQAKQNE